MCKCLKYRLSFVIGVLMKHLECFYLFSGDPFRSFDNERFKTLILKSVEGLKDKVLKSAHHGCGGQAGCPWA